MFCRHCPSGEFNEEVLESEPGLKVIARHGAGYDNIDIEAAKRLGISVTYDPVSNIGSVAEHVIALILGCSKSLFIWIGRRGQEIINEEMKC